MVLYHLPVPQPVHFIQYHAWRVDKHKLHQTPSVRELRGCLTLHSEHVSSTKSSDGNGFVLTTVGDSSRRAAFSTLFVDSERAKEPCEASWSSEVDPRLPAMAVISLDNDFDGCRDAVAEIGDCTCGVGVSGASLLG